jgi:hypothetical protein
MTSRLPPRRFANPAWNSENFEISSVRVRRGEGDDRNVDELLSGVLEIDGDAMSIDGLHLSYTPIRTLRMADKISRGRQESAC